MNGKLHSQLEWPNTELGYPAANFGLHSLKAGMSDHLFKRHGRLKTDNAKDGYKEDSAVHLEKFHHRLIGHK